MYVFIRKQLLSSKYMIESINYLINICLNYIKIWYNHFGCVLVAQ